jgi:Uma2 family endonuclease
MAARFENPCPFRLTREQFHDLSSLGFFGSARVELLNGEAVETYPDDPSDPEPRPFRFTREQFYRMGELGFFEARRVELVLGELVALAPVSEAHVASVTLAGDQLRVAFGPNHYVRVQAPLNLAVIDPLPDLAVVPGGPRDYAIAPTTALLIIEVADTTLAHDTTKAELYATAGVPEYWVIDLEHRQLIVFRDPQPLPEGLGATAYKTHLTFGPADRVAALFAPTAPVLVGELLP